MSSTDFSAVPFFAYCSFSWLARSTFRSECTWMCDLPGPSVFVSIAVSGRLQLRVVAGLGSRLARRAAGRVARTATASCPDASVIVTFDDLSPWTDEETRFAMPRTDAGLKAVGA